MPVTRRSHWVSCVPDIPEPDSVRDLQGLQVGIQHRAGFRVNLSFTRLHQRVYSNYNFLGIDAAVEQT